MASSCGVGSETEAFLDGRYLELVLAGGGALRTAPWMWLNAVAHGSPARVRELAGGNDPASDGRTMQWSEARVLVARQLLARSGDDPELMAALQLAALVPLELDIMCDDATTPLGLVAHALAELAGPQV